VDHRGNLLQAIANARGEHGKASAEDMLAFKTAVTRILTQHASAILLDPQYGMGAIANRAPDTGVMLAYEKSGYDVTLQSRLPDLLSEWSVLRLKEAGARGIKILLYYNPFDEAYINSIKQAYVERIGAECVALDVPFFLEPLVYDNALGDEREAAFARKKPAYIARTMEEFSQSRYSVDVLKVELPVSPAFVAGTRAFNGRDAIYSQQEAIEHFRNTASATTKPFIYLSGGSTSEVFCEMLELAADAGVKYAGVLCGRATWQEGIPIYAQEGVVALEHWLIDQGTRHLQSINAAVTYGAQAWWGVYGGKDNIEVVENT
jgi:tagatose 1,6-diphosphate aldolase